MSKDQILADAISGISSGQAQVLQQVIGDALDKMALEQKASDGTLSQSDLDNAVAAQKAADQAALDAAVQKDIDDVKAGQDALQAAQDLLAAANVALADMTSNFNADEVIVGGLKGVVSQMQAADQQLQGVVAALNSLGSPAPVPAP